MAKRNYISDDFAAKLERARRRTQRTPQPHLSVPPPHSAPNVSSLFLVYNNGSETIPEFAVMQVEELSKQYGEFSGQTKDAYSVIQPDGEGSLFLVNAGGEIKAGHFGAGMFATEACKVLIDEDASTTFLDTFGPVSGEWHLGLAGFGFLFLGLRDEDDSGIVTAIFREAPPAQQGWGKLSEALSPADSATVAVWRHNGTANEDTGREIEAHDLFLADAADDLPIDTIVWWVYDLSSKRYYITQAKCMT